MKYIIDDVYMMNILNHLNIGPHNIVSFLKEKENKNNLKILNFFFFFGKVAKN